MKKHCLKWIFSVVLILMVAEDLFVELAYANPGVHNNLPPLITINSPLPNETCNKSSLSFSVNVDVFAYSVGGGELLKTLDYSIDYQYYQDYKPLSFIKSESHGRQIHYPGSFNQEYSVVYYNATGILWNLSNGKHILRITGLSSWDRKFSEEVTFTVNIPEPTVNIPESTVNTPEAQSTQDLLSATTIIVSTVLTAALIVTTSTILYYKKSK